MAIKGQPVTLVSNVKIQPAPPTAWLPNQSGIVIPAGCTTAKLVLSPSSSLVGDSFTFAGEATVDGSTWFEMWTAAISGITTAISEVDIIENLGAIAADGTVIAPPIAWRLRVDSTLRVTIPSLFVTFN